MSKNRTNLEKAAGKLISSVQKEWGAEFGESQAEVSENVLDKAHDILQAAKSGNLKELLKGQTVSEFLGELWIKRHPGIKSAVSLLEDEFESGGNV